MPSHSHRVFTDWRVKGDLGQAVQLLTGVADWPRWWGQVIKSTAPDPSGEGFVIRSKGLLPLGLRWRLRVVDQSLPYRWVTEISGDLQGRGLWHLRQAGAVVEVEHEWQPHGLPFLSGVGNATHRWLLAQAKSALITELEAPGRVGNLPLSPDLARSANQAAPPARLRPIQ